MMGGMAGMAPEMMQAHSAMHHFNMAVHMSEIEDGQMAMSKTSNAQVRQFAQQMVTEHTTAMQREEQMMMSMGMGMKMGMGSNGQMDMGRMRTMLMENPHSRPVMEAHMRAMQMMQGVSGMAFDRAYMQNQVAMHRYALENVDRMMAQMGMTSGGSMSAQGGAGMDGGMSGNMDSGMKGGMQGMMMMEKNNRAMIAAHLQMAQQIMGSMRSM
jgi:putative membrane protein